MRAVIEFKTVAERDRLSKALDKMGARWTHGTNLLSFTPMNSFPYCYYLDGVRVSHSSTAYFKRTTGYPNIVSVDEFLKTNKKEGKMKLKVYDTVYLKKAYGGAKKGTKLEYVGGANFNVFGEYGKNLVIYGFERDEYISTTAPTAEKKVVAEKFKVGDKVKVVKSQGYMDHKEAIGKVGTVTRADDNVNVKYDTKTYPHSSVFFPGGTPAITDCLELVKRVAMPKHRRTFRLLQENVELNSGALIQEACDDGNQAYVLLEGQEGILKVDDLEEYDIELSFSRKTVEGQPTWFEEVFKAKKTVEKWLTKPEYIAFKSE